MRLHNEIVLSQARLLGVRIQPTKEEPIVTLAFRASLTREVSDAFGCRELIFAGDVPRSGVDKMALEGDEIDCECHFKHDSMAFSAVASEVGAYVAKMDAEGPQLFFRVKLKSYAAVAAELVEKVKHDPLEVVLKPAQIPLDLVEEGAPAADDSERIISKEQAEDTKGADEDGPSLAPAALVGGTHQRGTKKNRNRREPIVDAEVEDQPATAEDEGGDFMAELGIPESVR